MKVEGLETKAEARSMLKCLSLRLLLKSKTLGKKGVTLTALRKSRKM